MQSRDPGFNTTNMERWIIWFIPENKTIQLRQFHTEAETMKDAIENLKNEAKFVYRIMGVSSFNSLGSAEQIKKNEAFKNNSFY